MRRLLGRPAEILKSKPKTWAPGAHLSTHVKNHLIIGLGGTGGKIIRALRKTIFEQFRELDAPHVRLGYLYLDSNPEMMGIDDPTWRILGRSVQLPPASQLLIAGNNLASTIENVEAFPGISPWIGGKGDWRNILGAAEAANIVGGQKRRLGRFLFACKAAEFLARLRSTVNQLTTRGEAAVTFHVCCGLAGGTGSGSVIDVVSQIRKLYPHRSCRIIVYALLPDEHPLEGWAGPNYHANGYAALLELNALSTGYLHPHDVSGERTGRIENQDPFNCCYLFTNENQGGFKVDVDSALPEIVASFLFEKTVTNARVTWDALRRAEDFEVGSQAITPENDPSNTRPERSRRFFTFGIKQISYPEEEILEYLTYSFAEQAALQLSFNAWTESGYSPEPVHRNFHEFVRQPDTLINWRLAEQHLTLSEGILAGEISNPRWRVIATDWSQSVSRIQQDIRDAFPDTAWYNELAKACETRFVSTYRDQGVSRFYETKRKDIRTHVAEIRRLIEADLFAQWQNGAQSIKDIDLLLSALNASLRSRRDEIPDKIARCDQESAAAREKLNHTKNEWARAGIIAGWLGRRDRLFDAAALNSQLFFTACTQKEGWMFAKDLLDALINDLDGMIGEIGAINQMLDDGLTAFRAQRDARCRTAEVEGESRQHVRLYDPERVKAIATLLIRDDAEQRSQTKSVRDALTRKIGEQPSFSKFRERIRVSDLVATLESVCEESVRTAHANLMQSAKTKDRLLSVSIIGKLRDRYAGNPDQLRLFLSKVTTEGMNYLTFNPAECGRQGPGIPGDATCLPTFTVIMPEAEEHHDFCEHLKKEFHNVTSGRAHIVINKEKQNVITLVNITHGFPIRFARPVEELRRRYESRMQGDNRARAALELHVEGDGAGLPSLYPESSEVAKRNALPFLILARVLGLVTESDGRLFLVTKDDDGFDHDPVALGGDLVEAYERLDLRVSHLVRDSVVRTLSVPGQRAPELRESNRTSVVRLIDSIKEKRGVADSGYRALLDGGKKAVQLLKQENGHGL